MEYKCKFEVSGKVLEVGDVQEFASGFTKREVIVEASKKADEFSNPVCVTLKKEMCEKADSLRVGDGVAFEGFVEGRRWEKDGKVRYFIDLSAKSILVTDKAAAPTTAKSWKELLALGEAYGDDKEDVTAMCKDYGKPFKEMTEADWQKLAAQIVEAHKGTDAPADGGDDTADEDLPF
jgi:single-stranded DNA-binding protein